MDYVAYYRVSTKKQELGLEAQKHTVSNFVKDDIIIKEFTEKETGKNNNRPELKAAILYAKQKKAKLIIAKLDRLSRNASFIHNLRDSKVDFICCDLPDANTLTIGIFASLAQHEREIISKRTKDALQAKKAKGFKLGTPQNLTYEAIKRGMEIRKENAQKNKNNKQAFTVIESLRIQGLSYRAIAQKLSDSEFKTRRGNNFHASQVRNICIIFQQ